MIILVLVATMVLSCGAMSTPGFFLPAMIEEFGQGVTATSAAFAICASFIGLAGLTAGWMLQRVDAKIVILTGIGLVVIGGLVISRAQNLTTVYIGQASLGAGMGFSFVVPCSFVATNWFSSDDRVRRRGLAVGVVMSAPALAGTLAAFVTHTTIEFADWRTAYVVLTAPALLIAAPFVALLVRSKPPSLIRQASGAEVSVDGLTVREALRRPAFWILIASGFACTFAASSVLVHIVNYLTLSGYPTGVGANTIAGFIGISALGSVLMGFLADRFGPRAVFASLFFVEAAALVFLMQAAEPIFLYLFVFAFGITWVSAFVLIPLMIVTSLGRRSLAIITGLCLGLGNAMGEAGPMVVAALFERTGSYAAGYAVVATLLFLIGLASLTIRKSPAAQAT